MTSTRDPHECLDVDALYRLLLKKHHDSVIDPRPLTATESAMEAVISERLVPGTYFLLFNDETVDSNFTSLVASSLLATLRLRWKFAEISGRCRSRGRSMHAISEGLEFVRHKLASESVEEFRSTVHPRISAKLAAVLLLLFTIPGDKELSELFKKNESLAKFVDVSVWEQAGGDSALALQGFHKTFERPASFWDQLFPKDTHKSPDWQRKLFVFGAAALFIGFVMSGQSVLGTGASGEDEYENVDDQ